ncbi:MAG: CHAT domain-containing protein, partial [Acidobacteriota bacterium]
RRLYDSLFEGKIGDRFRLDQERHPGELVLRLTFDPDESDKLELYALPWELLHDEDDYLSLTDRPIVRRLRADRRVAEEPLVASRLKVLALPLADDGLDLEKEVEHLKSVGSSEESKVFDLEICDRRMSLADFRRRVERSKAQVLHLMGHGRWSVESRAWGVDFDDRFVSAEELAAAIHSKLEAVRLVVLNTCHSARALEPGTLTANKGLAAALVSSGAVAVLANRAPIGDAAALTLSRLFYSRIANGMSLPRALVRTRWDLADSHRVGHDILPGEWATPVLHLRTRGRVLVIEQRLGLSPGTAGALLLGSAGSVGLLATGGVYVAHRPAALGAAVAAIAAAGRLAWNGLRYRAAEKHVVTWLIERLNAHPRRVRRVAALLVGLGFVLWAFVGRPRVDALPCLERAPHLGDWIDRGVVLSFGESEGWEGAWRRSLEGAMTSAGLALIPP